MITFSQRNFSGLVLIQVQLYWTWTRYDNEIVKKNSHKCKSIFEKFKSSKFINKVNGTKLVGVRCGYRVCKGPCYW